jgi:hypothetical protein
MTAINGPMAICARVECQSTAGCAWRGPNGQLCYFPQFGKSLADYSDEEITREYHARALRKLGDQRVGVGAGFAGLPYHLQPTGGKFP